MHVSGNWPKSGPRMSRGYDPDRSHDRFTRIKEVYDILVEYGMNFELSFRAEDIRKGTDYDSREFWMNLFGDDPIWG